MHPLRYALAISTLIVAPLYAAETMTAARFSKIAETPGDTKPLNAHVAQIPNWPKFTVQIDLKYESGEQKTESFAAKSKTVNGEYLVCWFDSPLYQQRLYSITGYNSTTKKYNTWSLYGTTLVEAEFDLDLKSRTTKGSSTISIGADIIKESTTGAYEPKRVTERSTVTRNGAKFMTRTTILTPDA